MHQAHPSGYCPGHEHIGYISNILVDHIQQHWEEINELYNKEYYKPLKPF